MQRYGTWGQKVIPKKLSLWRDVMMTQIDAIELELQYQNMSISHVIIHLEIESFK